MNKLFSLLYLTAYILAFIGCEYLIHRVEDLSQPEATTYFVLRFMEFICGVGAVIEILEITFGIEIKEKLKRFFNKWDAPKE